MIRSFLALTLALALAQPLDAQRLTSSQRDLYARVIQVGDTRTLDTLAVDLALGSSSAPLASFAALTVGQLGRAAAAPRIARLRGLLVDPRTDVAANAAFALGLLRDTVAIASLSQALGAGDRRAAEAAWALGQIGEPARAVIVAALGSDAVPPDVRIQLLLAASRFRPVPAEAVAPHLRSPDGSVAWAAAYALARQRVPAGVRSLIELAGSPVANGVAPGAAAASGYYGRTRISPERIRAEIARGVARPAAGDSLGDTAFALLSRYARDAHAHVRINALRSLATFEARAVPLLDSAAADRDPNVRLAALQAIATMRDVTFDWTRLWATDTSFTYRRYVAEAAAAQNVPMSQLSAWVSHSDWRRRAAFAGAMGVARDTVLRSSVLPLVADPDPRVRGAALAVIGADTAALAPAVHVLIRERIADPDETVRAVAIGALGRRPNPADIPAVVAMLADAHRDAEPDAAVAAVQYLAAAWRRDSSLFTPALREQIAGLQSPANPAARAAAAGFPLLRQWTELKIEPRARGWYLEAVDRYVVPSLAGRAPVAVIRTAHGPITLELFAADAPLTVRNFAELARRGYYGGTEFHRVVPNFVAQDGDPTGSGSGGPGYSIRDELNFRRYERGVLGMALSGPDTGGSQWFITHSPQPHLDGGYTVFGRVTAGYAALDALVQGDRIVRIDIR